MDFVIRTRETKNAKGRSAAIEKGNDAIPGREHRLMGRGNEGAGMVALVKRKTAVWYFAKAGLNFSLTAAE
jgi:hypothetical protein